jgi:hypothetical protein
MAQSTPDSVEHDPDVAQAVLPFWRVPWEFAVHGIVGTAIFAIIAGLAVGLDLAVSRLKAYHVSILIIDGLQVAEYALFAVDICLFLVYLWRTGRRTIKRL